MRNLIWILSIFIGVALSGCDEWDSDAVIRNYSNDTIIDTINHQYPGNITEITKDYDQAYVIPVRKESGRLFLWEAYKHKPKTKQIVILRMIEDNMGEVIGILNLSNYEYGGFTSYFVYPDDFMEPTEKVVIPVDTLYIIKRQDF